MVFVGEKAAEGRDDLAWETISPCGGGMGTAGAQGSCWEGHRAPLGQEEHPDPSTHTLEALNWCHSAGVQHKAHFWGVMEA